MNVCTMKLRKTKKGEYAFFDCWLFYFCFFVFL